MGSNKGKQKKTKKRAGFSKGKRLKKKPKTVNSGIANLENERPKVPKKALGTNIAILIYPYYS